MGKKILITEDSPTILEILKSVLVEQGYEVIVATDGQEALEKARTEKPDLMILDLMLPKIDGYKVCRMLKFDEKYKNIPIIMLTARTKESDEKLGREVGADAYMKKPFEPEMIIDQIKKLLNP
jgi:two-component system, OmpR family, alkaline phosphatase synthesis response regulator PhoP